MGWENISPIKRCPRNCQTPGKEITIGQKVHGTTNEEHIGTLNGFDNWSKGWVVFEHQHPSRIRRQHGGGSIMIWAGIIIGQIIVPVRVPEGVKFCGLLQPPWISAYSL